MHIKNYFRKVEDLINSCKAVQSAVITFDERSRYIGFIKGAIYFIDGSVLHLREFADVREKIEVYKYSYHYQKEDKLIFRYDNAKDSSARQLSTFPEHKHIGNEVTASKEPELSQILDEITEWIEL
ncbi:MAG: DUF6516 family protein [bacterium]